MNEKKQSLNYPRYTFIELKNVIHEFMDSHQEASRFQFVVDIEMLKENNRDNFIIKYGAEFESLLSIECQVIN